MNPKTSASCESRVYVMRAAYDASTAAQGEPVSLKLMANPDPMVGPAESAP